MTTGIVLSGGGARCYAHLGVLEALDERGFSIQGISATSAGSMAGAFYAGGMKPLEIKKLFDQYSIFSVKNMYLSRIGIFKSAQLESILEEHLPAKTFEELKIKLYITATDVINGTSVSFFAGSIIKPAVASCCIPFLFEPITFNDTQWVDGGVMDNFPIVPLLGHYDRILGSHVNPILPLQDTSLSRRRLLERCYHLAITNVLQSKQKACTLFFEPKELAQYSVFDQQKSTAIFQLGYDHACNILDKYHNDLSKR